MGNEGTNPRDFPFPTGPLTWQTVVGASGRMRLPVHVIECVNWLKGARAGQPLDCIARVGARRQLLITPSMPAPTQELVAKIVSPLVDDDNEDALGLARYASGMWLVRLSVEHRTRRREFILPRGARLAQVAPEAGTTAIVFALHSRLEIWRHDLWIAVMAEWEANRADRIDALTELFRE